MENENERIRGRMPEIIEEHDCLQGRMGQKVDIKNASRIPKLPNIR